MRLSYILLLSILTSCASLDDVPEDDCSEGLCDESRWGDKICFEGSTVYPTKKIGDVDEWGFVCERNDDGIGEWVEGEECNFIFDSAPHKSGSSAYDSDGQLKKCMNGSWEDVNVMCEIESVMGPSTYFAIGAEVSGHICTESDEYEEGWEWVEIESESENG